MAGQDPINRRRFFRHGLRELLKPLANAVEPLERAIEQFEKFEQQVGNQPSKKPVPPPKSESIWLRPPGALNEPKFQETCSRCGNCVRVCPAQCIKIDSTGKLGDGAPYIDPDEMPCIVCDGLVCMRSCPTEALVPTALGLLNMGTAMWNEQTCVRSKGEDCKICVDQCPIGEVAIELIDNRIAVRDRGCTGCGVCQHHCPTSPKSIVVKPR